MQSETLLAAEVTDLHFTASGEVTLIAADGAEGTAKGPKRFTGTAYDGGPMRPAGFSPYPTVVDMAGLKAAKSVPMLRQHSDERMVGHTDAIDISPKGIKVAGALSGVGPDVDQITATAANGFPWQLSIGATVEKREFVEEGRGVNVNGRRINGPVNVVRAATLREISFVPVGASDGTSAAIAAAHSGGSGMNEFDTWVQAQGFDPATLTPTQKTTLTAAHAASKAPPATLPTDLDTVLGDARREQERQTTVANLIAKYAADDMNKLDQFERIGRLAITAKWDAQRVELELLRAARPAAPFAYAPSGQNAVSETVLEAAVCMSARLPDVEKRFNEQTLEAANKRFKQGIGLLELVAIAAERNANYRGSSRDLKALCEAAFRANGQNFLRADVGTSTISVPDIVSNVANKFLLAQWLFTEQSWRKICKIAPVKDFKATTRVRLTGANTFERTGPGGEIKSGTLSDMKYSNQAATYAKGLGINREDFINDDLNAFTGVMGELARGAGDLVNNLVWTEFLDDAAFFPTDASLGNYQAGSNTALAVAGLEIADTLFRIQTKPDGTPLGAEPKILLVPTGLHVTARTLMMSTALAGTTGTLTPAANPWAGMFEVVASTYLRTGSTTAWYLAASPEDIATIEVVFLNGKDFPTVESAPFDFDRLGLAMRGYLDVGCKKQEYRGAVKLKGVA